MNLKCLIALLLTINIVSGQTDASKLYKQGLKYHKKKKYIEADSCFSKSIELEPKMEKYYDYAMTKKKLNKDLEYCSTLEIGKECGGKESSRLFCAECVTVDSIFVDEKGDKGDSNKYSYKIRTTIYKYSSKKKVDKFDVTGKNVLSYTVEGGDTLFVLPPDEEANNDKFENVGYKIRDNLTYPFYERMRGIQGVVWIQFCIEKDGSINDIKVLSSPSLAMTTEVLRVIKLIGNFGIMEYNHKAIRLKMIKPINFVII